jgi:hypothetical protein
MSPNEHSRWRDFLRPLVEAAVTALAVYAAGVQHVSSTSFDSRISVVETKVEGISELRKDVNDLSKNVHELIGEIRAERRQK